VSLAGELAEDATGVHLVLFVRFENCRLGCAELLVPWKAWPRRLQFFGGALMVWALQPILSAVPTPGLLVEKEIAVGATTDRVLWPAAAKEW
jgi:hypothetical protein